MSCRRGPEAVNALQGFLSRTEGAIFKWVRKGSPAAAPWQILKQDGENLRQVLPAL